MHHTKRIRRSLVAGVGALSLVTLSACSAAESGGGGGSSSGGGEDGYDQVTIAQPGWVGAEANVAVAKHVMENELDLTVEVKQIDESLAWDGMDDGSVHAILEDWGGAPDKEQLYVEEKESVVQIGYVGVVGQIGWFVPQAYADENPEVLHWENLNDFAEDFQTAESGGKGQLLNGDPGFTSYDHAIVEQLDLDFQVVEGGSEDALISAIRQADRDGTPLLTYWWEPHWLNAEVGLAKVELPEYTEGCQDDADAVACDYPETPLPKFLNADFEEHGGEAAQFLKNFEWSTEDQNHVAELIQGGEMTAEDAAAQWAEENPDTVAAWLP